MLCLLRYAGAPFQNIATQELAQELRRVLVSANESASAATAMMNFGIDPDDEGESMRVVDLVFRQVCCGTGLLFWRQLPLVVHEWLNWYLCVTLNSFISGDPILSHRANASRRISSHSPGGYAAIG